MLLKRPLLEAIAAGSVSLVLRRWKRPTVKAGGTLLTAIGVLAIDEVAAITEADIDDESARMAGYNSSASLKSELGARLEGDLYRIALRYSGEDPRRALGAKDGLAPDEYSALAARLDKLDGKNPWTSRVLHVIDLHPGRRAVDLAQMLGRETQAFKRDVRKLKALGLTVSFDIGYRLSPRGSAYRAFRSGKQ